MLSGYTSSTDILFSKLCKVVGYFVLTMVFEQMSMSVCVGKRIKKYIFKISQPVKPSNDLCLLNASVFENGPEMEEKKGKTIFPLFLFCCISAFVVRVIFVVLRVEFFSHQCTNTYFDDAHKYYNKNSITSIYFSWKKMKNELNKPGSCLANLLQKMGPFLLQKGASP